MKQLLATMTEWAWCQNALEDKAARNLFAAKFFEILRVKYPRVRTCHKTALEAIADDVEKIYQRLTYGGRKPADMHPRRLETLRQTFFATH